MKVAYDFQAFGQRYGGVPLYFSKLAQHINNFGLEARIYTPIFQNQFIKDFPKSIVKGVGLNQYPPKTKKIIWQLNKTLSTPKIRNWRPDIFHQTYYNYTPESFGEKARIITVYDMIHEKFPESFPIRDATSSLKLRTIKEADHIVCISECTKRDLISMTNVNPSKVSCIHLGIDLPDEQCGYPFGAQKIQRPYLLYVGARTPYKNFSTLLTAYAASTRLVRDFDLVVVGGGSLTHKELAMLDKLHLSLERVICADTLTYSINSFYQYASAFIYPSLYEGFGLPPLEAMANGCPVISSNAGPLPEVNGRAAEYFDPSLGDDLCLAIERVVYDNIRAKELQNLGFEQIKKYSWERCAKETVNLYRSLM